MHIFKSKYHGVHRPTVLKRHLILPTINNAGNEIIYFTLYIIPKKMPIEYVLTSPTFKNEYADEVESNFYITVYDKLSYSNLHAIEKFIKKHYTTVIAYKPKVGIQSIDTFDYLHTLMVKYNSVYVHFSRFVTKDYSYMNIPSCDDSIHVEDEIILYKAFNNRNTLDIYHAKYKDYRYDVFMGYPLYGSYKVMILDHRWNILPESDNKIAHLYDGEIHLWLISKNYIFTSYQENTRNDFGATTLNCNKLNDCEIERIIQKFQEFHFNDISFTEKCVYSEDKYNKLLLFTGLISHDESTPYNEIVKRFV